jgi:putative ABC transport system permease protein
VIKTSLPSSAVGNAVQQAVLGVDSEQPISRVRTLDETLAGAVAVERFTTLLATLFAGLALALAAVGAFGVVSHVWPRAGVSWASDSRSVRRTATS